LADILQVDEKHKNKLVKIGKALIDHFHEDNNESCQVPISSIVDKERLDVKEQFAIVPLLLETSTALEDYQGQESLDRDEFKDRFQFKFQEIERLLSIDVQNKVIGEETWITYIDSMNELMDGDMNAKIIKRYIAKIDALKDIYDHKEVINFVHNT